MGHRGRRRRLQTNQPRDPQCSTRQEEPREGAGATSTAFGGGGLRRRGAVRARSHPTTATTRRSLRGSSQAQAAGEATRGEGGRVETVGAGGRVAEPPGWLAALLRVVGSCRRVKSRADGRGGGRNPGRVPLPSREIRSVGRSPDGRGCGGVRGLALRAVLLRVPRLHGLEAASFLGFSFPLFF